MSTIPSIISQLFPKKTPEELESLVRDCLEYGVDYDEQDWLKVKDSDIVLWSVKRNLITTLYQIQNFGYSGIGFVIMDSLELWSNRTLDFAQLVQEDQDFCQRFYMLLGFSCFAFLGRRRQCYLLGSQFLPLAIIWNVPVYESVKFYFATQTYVWEMKEDAGLFSDIIKNSPIGLVGERGFKRSIANWISLFDAYCEKNGDTKVDEFLQNNIEVQRLDNDQKSLLLKVLTLYHDLVTGAIWFTINIDASIGNEHKEKTEVKPISEYYLIALEKIENEKIIDWLQSYKDVAKFIDSLPQPDKFVEKLFAIIKEKVDFKNEKQISLLLEFINLLKQGGWNEIDKIVYFDEKVGEFVWNKEYIG